MNRPSLCYLHKLGRFIKHRGASAVFGGWLGMVVKNQSGLRLRYTGLLLCHYLRS